MDKFLTYAKAIDKVIQKKMGKSNNKISHWLIYLMILTFIISFISFLAGLFIYINYPYGYLEFWSEGDYNITSPFFYYLGLVFVLGFLFTFLLLLIYLSIEKKPIGIIKKYSEIVKEIDKIIVDKDIDNALENR